MYKKMLGENVNLTLKGKYGYKKRKRLWLPYKGLMMQEESMKTINQVRKLIREDIYLMH